ncbi:unnamed protein product [Amoebophrya sp. A25]|nr:unnamed protein product [Amoebophrya sp. A25]|eukprot:GSA25T00004798001.1
MMSTETTSTSAAASTTTGCAKNSRVVKSTAEDRARSNTRATKTTRTSSTTRNTTSSTSSSGEMIGLGKEEDSSAKTAGLDSGIDYSETTETGQQQHHQHQGDHEDEQTTSTSITDHEQTTSTSITATAVQKQDEVNKTQQDDAGEAGGHHDVVDLHADPIAAVANDIDLPISAGLLLPTKMEKVVPLLALPKEGASPRIVSPGGSLVRGTDRSSSRENDGIVDETPSASPTSDQAEVDVDQLVVEEQPPPRHDLITADGERTSATSEEKPSEESLEEKPSAERASALKESLSSQAEQPLRLSPCRGTRSCDDAGLHSGLLDDVGAPMTSPRSISGSMERRMKSNNTDNMPISAEEQAFTMPAEVVEEQAFTISADDEQPVEEKEEEEETQRPKNVVVHNKTSPSTRSTRSSRPRLTTSRKIFHQKSSPEATISEPLLKLPYPKLFGASRQNDFDDSPHLFTEDFKFDNIQQNITPIRSLQNRSERSAPERDHCEQQHDLHAALTNSDTLGRSSGPSRATATVGVNGNVMMQASPSREVVVGQVGCSCTSTSSASSPYDHGEWSHLIIWLKCL